MSAGRRFECQYCDDIDASQHFLSRHQIYRHKQNYLLRQQQRGDFLYEVHSQDDNIQGNNEIYNDDSHIETDNLRNRQASLQNGYDLRTLPMPESTVLAGLRTHEKLGNLVKTYDHNIAREWSNICRKAGNILNSGNLALKEIANGNELTLTWAAQPTSIKMKTIKVLEDSYPDLRVACHSWVAEHVLRIKCESLRANERTAAHKIKSSPYPAGRSQGSFEGGMNTVKGDALPSVTSSRDHLGVATSNLPSATNIDEAMAAFEARMEVQIDTKLASIVALLENRLPGTESAAPPTLSPPAQPITRQSEGSTSLGKRPRDGRWPTSRQDDAFRQLTKKVDKRKQEKKGREAFRGPSPRGNIGNDKSDNESSDKSDDDTNEDLSPISKMPKIAGRGGRGVRGSRSGAIQRGAQSTSIKMNGNTMMRRKGVLY
ncbi:hypothetical protein K3495_g1411 [Podosphaera aphanis]|nr:hypothetical protein K3495_g1411 [Podosphaera aphanis]